MTICMYEDSQFDQFYPLTVLRPVASLRAGIVPLFKRGLRFFPDARLVLVTRHDISALAVQMNPDVPINIIKRDESEDVLFVNGRIRSWGDLADLVQNSRLSTRFVNDKLETIGVLFRAPIVNHTSKVTTPSEYVSLYEKEEKDIPDQRTTATLYAYLWDLVNDIDFEIAEDFRHLDRGPSHAGQISSGAHVVRKELIHLAQGSLVCAGAVIDATGGPVFVGENSRIESSAAVYGPSAIGANCIVNAGKFSAVSIGHTSRIGGEIEESVFQSYVNKYHAGFIGHSYVGSWVNFGAMTTNSDLKNNYSTIRVHVGGKDIDSGSIKVGSFIGDHTKFGIGTLLNTGIVIGVGCNVFGGTLVTDKNVPSFRWGSSSKWDTHEFDKALETASRTFERRKQNLSDHEKKALRKVFDNAQSAEGCVQFG